MKGDNGTSTDGETMADSAEGKKEDQAEVEKVEKEKAEKEQKEADEKVG